MKRKNTSSEKKWYEKLSWLEIISIGLSLWFLFYPEPYNLLLLVLLIIPVLGIFLNGFQEKSLCSLVTINKEKSKKYDVADFIDMPALVILLRVLLDFHIDDFEGFIVVGSVAFLLVILILFSTHKLIKESKENKIWIYTLIIFNVSLYSYAGTVAINCAFDESKPHKYSTTVIEKRISKGRRGRKTYYIKVEPWRPGYDEEEISVGKSKYNTTSKGDYVNIAYKEGLVGIPWYYLE